jgi:hypothetical protein
MRQTIAEMCQLEILVPASGRSAPAIASGTSFKFKATMVSIS